MSSDRLISGRYRLTDPIGSGAMGVVWRATDVRLRRTVAVKQLLLAPGLTGTQALEAKLRAMREGRIAARLHHPNAITVFDVAEEDGQPWLVMEYMNAPSLAVKLAGGATLPPLEVAGIGAQAAAALSAAHDAGIMHRDVKPANLLVGDDGTVKLTDFGISHATGDVTVTATGFLAGTPAYLAPEIARGDNPKPAADVFALGSTLYAAVEGAPPFGEGENPLAVLHAVARGVVPEPRQAGPLAPVLMWLLTTSAETRPTMAQARVALEDVAAGRVPALPGAATKVLPVGETTALLPDQGTQTGQPAPRAAAAGLLGSGLALAKAARSAITGGRSAAARAGRAGLSAGDPGQAPGAGDPGAMVPEAPRSLTGDAPGLASGATSSGSAEGDDNVGRVGDRTGAPGGDPAGVGDAVGREDERFGAAGGSVGIGGSGSRVRDEFDGASDGSAGGRDVSGRAGERFGAVGDGFAGLDGVAGDAAAGGGDGRGRSGAVGGAAGLGGAAGQANDRFGGVGGDSAEVGGAPGRTDDRLGVAAGAGGDEPGQRRPAGAVSDTGAANGRGTDNSRAIMLLAAAVAAFTVMLVVLVLTRDRGAEPAQRALEPVTITTVVDGKVSTVVIVPEPETVTIPVPAASSTAAGAPPTGAVDSPTATPHATGTTTTTTPSGSPPTPAPISEFVADYYGMLPGNASRAWAQLSPGYQASAGGYRSYAAFWSQFGSVAVSDVSHDGDVVVATVSYRYKNGSQESERRWFRVAPVNGTLLIVDSQRA
ncbi:serine/threonine-protein kinase [Nocardia rhizosphaerae]|uniref:non-specific serine/threonine protein kinase n=1 Tax=Nocardia rhizosphaerae TaxID=1691571 RepID=A0ABV8LCS5_9NOCA